MSYKVVEGQTLQNERTQDGRLRWSVVVYLTQKEMRASEADALSGARMTHVRRPTMEHFLVKKITAISRLLPLEFWCSEGHFAQVDQILTLF